VLSEKVPDEFSEELGDNSVCASKVSLIFKPSEKLTNL